MIVKEIVVCVMCNEDDVLRIGNDKYQWFVMAPVYFQENNIKKYLDEINVRNFLPMKIEIKVINGKKITKKVPAVNNLMFVFTTESNLKEICRVKPYLHYKYIKEDGVNLKMTVPQKQMEDFLRLSSIDDKSLIYFSPEKENLDLKKGEHIRLHSNNPVLDGIEGIYVKIKGKRDKRLVISLNGIHAVAMMVDISLIEKSAL